MTTIAIGTEKGGFLLDPDDGEVSEPLFPGWKVTAFGRSGEHYLAGVASNWFGPGIQRSTDLQEWTATDAPPSYGDDPEAEDAREVKAVWTFHRDDEWLWAGVEEAGLFRSADDGATWEGLDGFNAHRTRADWGPGLGGLCTHRVLTHGDRVYAAASAVGVFRSDDGGATFDLVNDGIPVAGMPADEVDERPETGYCVHNLRMDPADPDRLYRQDHMGVFRSDDGGHSWQRRQDGLPAEMGFGFVMAREGSTGRLFTQPLHSDGQRLPVDGAFRVYRSDDQGASWAVSGTGWSDAPTHTLVLRGAVDADDDGRVAVGTTSGAVWLTEDAGDSWRQVPGTFPRIGAVALW
ncbi:WD40/YVTN/BNR-like repeat-containing protein [Salsipaludibacter albus]|uniref:WD40/YVTN/BNR-like repeat-containing protein n=1 Tax=Salsipaludibacter albus TaxID=2849650 RepID=UPI001EE4B913|nr:exo-alpha-sialidase [Salsipaludibacter albus]MBY5164446.1 exo-alpha-sialidase [Salsipaludibacter albus]